MDTVAILCQCESETCLLRIVLPTDVALEIFREGPLSL